MRVRDHGAWNPTNSPVPHQTRRTKTEHVIVHAMTGANVPSLASLKRGRPVLAVAQCEVSCFYDPTSVNHPPNSSCSTTFRCYCQAHGSNVEQVGRVMQQSPRPLLPRSRCRDQRHQPTVKLVISISFGSEAASTPKSGLYFERKCRSTQHANFGLKGRSVAWQAQKSREQRPSSCLSPLTLETSV